MMFAPTPTVSHDDVPSVISTRTRVIASVPWAASRIRTFKSINSSLSICGYSVPIAVRNAWSSAFTGPLPSPVTTTRSPPARSFTVASLEAAPPGCELVITDSQPGGAASSEATVKLRAGGDRVVVTGEGNGPVNALDHALRTAIGTLYPQIDKLELIDLKVRILDAAHGTDAITRVLVEMTDGTSSWETVGVGANIIEASWEALTDGVVYGLLRQEREPLNAS